MRKTGFHRKVITSIWLWCGYTRWK